MNECHALRNAKQRRTLVRDGESRRIETRCESWHLTFWREGTSRVAGEHVDAVAVELERRGHNGPAVLTADEAAGLVTALFELLPETVELVQQRYGVSFASSSDSPS